MNRHLRGLRGTSLPVVAVLLALTALTGCSSNGTDDSTGVVSSGVSANRGSVPVNAGQGEDFSSSDAGAADTPQASPRQVTNATILEPRALIKTGSVSLHANDIGQALGDITAIVTAYGGEIASESTTTNDDGEQQSSQLELRVPVADFEAALDEIAELATLRDKHSELQDVTTQVVDVDARVQSARDTLESLRRLFVRATRLGQIITLETQLAQRQADLESLLAQQKSLADQTAMSTISVNVTQTPAKDEEPRDDDQAGFVAGIEQGWDALTRFAVGTGHAFGVALPLGSLFISLALIGWVVVRRRFPRPRTAPTQ